MLRTWLNPTRLVNYEDNSHDPMLLVSFVLCLSVDLYQKRHTAHIKFHKLCLKLHKYNVHWCFKPNHSFVCSVLELRLYSSTACMGPSAIKVLNLAVVVICLADRATQAQTDGNDTEQKNNMPLYSIFSDETKQIECEHCVGANLNRLIWRVHWIVIPFN